MVCRQGSCLVLLRTTTNNFQNHLAPAPTSLSSTQYIMDPPHTAEDGGKTNGPNLLGLVVIPGVLLPLWLGANTIAQLLWPLWLKSFLSLKEELEPGPLNHFLQVLKLLRTSQMLKPAHLVFKSVRVDGICTICSICPPSLSFFFLPVPPSLSLASFSSVTGHLVLNKNAHAVSLPYLLIFTNIHTYGSSHQPSPGSFLTPGQMTPGFTAIFPKWVCSVYDSQ